MKRNFKSLRILPEHAARALHTLMAEGKIAAKDVAAALKRREALISDLRKRLTALEAGIVEKVKPKGKTKPKAKRGVGRHRQRRLSAATRAKYRQQGRYMAAVRRLPKAGRAKVKAIREKSGVAAAVAAAKRMAK
jgi:hypothetical protein